MSDLSLGTISAAIQLRFDQLIAAAAKSTATIEAMSASIEASISEMQSTTQASMDDMGVAMSGLATGGAMAVTAALGAIIAAGSDVEQSMLHLQANTNSTDEQMSAMSETIMNLGEKSGASLKSLTDGMMHVANFGYQAGEAMKIMDAATESAVATGADAGKTANLLAATLHEFGMSGDDAANAMNMLHTAAAKGNATLEEFVQAAGPVFGAASNMGVSLQDAAAAMTTLTQHGFDMSRAATQVQDILIHIAAPTKKVTDYIEGLGAAGAVLAEDFTQAGLRTKGLSGIIADIGEVSAKTGIRASDMATHLIQAQRGGLGFMSLLGSGLKDLNIHLQENADMMAGKSTPAADGYNKELNTLGTTMGRLKNSAIDAASGMFKAWEPVLTKLASMAATLLEKFAQLAKGSGKTMDGMSAEEMGRYVADQQREKARRAPIDAQLDRVSYLIAHQKDKPLTPDQLFGTAPIQKPFDPARDIFGGMADSPILKAGFKPTHAPPKKKNDDDDDDDKADKRAAAADKAADALDKLKEAAKQFQDRLYALTHTDFDVQRRDARQQFHEDAANPQIGVMQANEAYAKTLTKINNESKQALRDRAKEFVDANKTIGEAQEKAASEEEALNEKRRRGALVWLEYWKDAIDKYKQAQGSAFQQVATGFAATMAGMVRSAAATGKQIADDLVKEQQKSFDIWLKDFQRRLAEAAQPKAWQVALQKMQDQAKSILVDGLGNALTHGFKGFFQSILQQFEQMLAQMVAKAVVSGIFSLLSGGGSGIFGGGGGIFSALGFDSGANDAMARRWGFDGMYHAMKGMDSARSSFGRSAGAGGGNTHVEVHMHGPHNYGNGMDVRKVADQLGQHIAYKAQVRSRTVVGS